MMTMMAMMPHCMTKLLLLTILRQYLLLDIAILHGVQSFSVVSIDIAGSRKSVTRSKPRHDDYFSESSFLLHQCASSSSSVPDTRTAPSTKKSSKETIPAAKIIICSSTNELVEAIRFHVLPHHNVAELGSQLRDVSTQICESLQATDTTEDTKGMVQLVDVERKFPSSFKKSKNPQSSAETETRTAAMRREEDDPSQFYPSIATFHEIPELKDWKRALFPFHRSVIDPNEGQRRPFDVFVADVNVIVGNDLEWTSLQVIQEFESLNNILIQEEDEFNEIRENEHIKVSKRRSPLLVLVKSVGLNSWASRLYHGQNWIRHQNETDPQILAKIPPPQIVGTVGVAEYRSTIPYAVRPGDRVIEVGCHFGTTTALINDHLGGSGYVLGVDVGSKIIREATKKYPSVYFRTGDAWKCAELLRIQQDFLRKQSEEEASMSESVRRIGFDVVFIDVGGLSGSDGQLEAVQLISSIRYALEPRCIVIKSLCMRRLASALVPFRQIQRKQNADGTRK